MYGNDSFGRALAAVDDINGWLRERIPGQLPVETVPLAAADGRILAAAVHADADMPAAPCATCDGIALTAAATAGAGLYSPLRLSPAELHLVEYGDKLPQGCDAVVAREAVTRDGDAVLLTTPLAAGEHVRPTGADWQVGATLGQRGAHISTANLATLSAAGVEQLTVRARPRLSCIVAGRVRDTDTNTPMLAQLLRRDGAQADTDMADDADMLRRKLTATTASAAIVHGASGLGERDFAARVLADTGTLVWHGAAAVPGESFGAGVIGDTTVLLLPGAPWACLAAYELFAAAFVRGLAGSSRLQSSLLLPLATKLASPLGRTELRAVALRDGCVWPLPHSTFAPPAAASGFVQVEAGSEGQGEGDLVEVRLW